MKELLTMLAIMISFKSFAQDRQFCILGASTHPNSIPTNAQIQSLPIYNGSPDLRFINKWVWWMDPLNPNWQNYITLNNMGLSASEPYGNTMEPINSLAYTGYYLYLDADYQEVMHPNGGWELITFNRGWYADNQTAIDWSGINSGLRSIPYLLFYNKYKGTARVFFRYGNNTDPANSIDYASIELYHEVPDGSGIMRLGQGLDQTLDRPSAITTITTRVPSPGQAELWFSADFQLAYDPCVCNYESSISLRFTFFKSATIELNGRAVTATEELSSESFMSDPNYVQNFLGNIDGTENNDLKQGNIIYQHMRNLLDDYEKRLNTYKKKLQDVNQYNAEIEEAEAVIEIAKIVLNLGVTAVTGMPDYTSILSKIPAVKAMADSPSFGKETQKAFWKVLDKVLLKGFDLLVKDDLKKKTVPQKPNMPTVSFTELSFSGNISQQAAINTYQTSTPGSKRSNVINNDQATTYPLYDEALGIFALLERPQVYVSSATSDIQSWEYFQFMQPPQLGFQYYYESWSDYYQFKIKDNLKYYFNPALEIESYDIDAAFEVISTPIFVGGYVPSRFSAFIDPNNTVNFTSNQISLESYSPLKTTNFGYNEGQNYCCESFAPSTSCSCAELSVAPTNIESVQSTSQFVPLNAFNNFYSSLAIKNQYFEQQLNDGPFDPLVNPMNEGFKLVNKVFLKLKVNVTFSGTNADGDPNEFTYLFTYEVLPEDIINQTTDLYPNLPGSPADFTQYPENILFNGTVFNGTPVEGCELNGNEYFCKAWNDIQITGNITIANNYNVIFEAGNEVAVLPTAIIPPSATLRLNSPFDFSNPMPEASPAYVSSFCNGANAQYQANTLRADILAYYDSLALEEENVTFVENSFNASIFPNPTNGETQASITLPESAVTSIKVIDMSGKIVAEPLKDEVIQKGKTEFNLMTTQLTPGIYFINITVNGERRVLRLIKQ
jgi:hypothetical protein